MYFTTFNGCIHELVVEDGLQCSMMQDICYTWSVKLFAVSAPSLQNFLSVISENLRYGFSKYTASNNKSSVTMHAMMLYRKLSKMALLLRSTL